MILIFSGVGEHCQFEIDREQKKVKFIGSNTNYQEQELPWKMLWDKCMHHKMNQRKSNIGCRQCMEVVRKQDREAEKLDNKKFANLIKDQMQLYGYELKKWEF